jgi:hypothetical protein
MLAWVVWVVIIVCEMLEILGPVGRESTGIPGRGVRVRIRNVGGSGGVSSSGCGAMSGKMGSIDAGAAVNSSSIGAVQIC